MNVVIGDTALEAESTLFGASPSTLGFRDPPGTIRELDPDGRPMLSPSEQSELNQGLHQFETLMESGLDIGFDAFELFVLRNILVVREDLCPWIRLEHHKVCLFLSSFLPPFYYYHQDSCGMGCELCFFLAVFLGCGKL
jgi:kinetochore protein Mis12/MTW1